MRKKKVNESKLTKQEVLDTVKLLKELPLVTRKILVKQNTEKFAKMEPTKFTKEWKEWFYNACGVELNEGIFNKTIAFNVYKKNKKTGYSKKIDTVFYPSSWIESEVKHELVNRQGFDPNIVVIKESTKKIIDESTSETENDMISNIRDALMYLKMTGNTKVPTELVLNEFEKMGIQISLEQLQEMFPTNDDLLKNIDKDYIEFNFDYGTPGVSKTSSKDTVSDLASKAVSAKKS